MNKKSIVILIILVIIVLVVAMWSRSSTTSGSVTNVSYLCNEGKTIDVIFHKGDVIQGKAGGPPTFTGTADVKLSDGRMMTLGQTLSADGVRYANTDESFVFWSKGNGALVLENNEEKSYIGCVVVKGISDKGLTHMYHGEGGAFSIRYPDGFIPDSKYVYEQLGPGKDIYGVKFVIPESYATGTNLGVDSYVSVEQLPRTSTCTATNFIYKGVNVSTTTDNDTEYSVASSTDAAAGNRYQEIVYAIPGTNPCTAVRYLIHYGVFENYPAGTIKEFKYDSLLSVFDAIRRSLTVNQ